MPITDAKKRANAKYHANNVKQFNIDLPKTTCTDIIQRLEDVENKRAYIVGLIRSDLYRKHAGKICSFDFEIRSDNASKYAEVIEEQYSFIRDQFGHDLVDRVADLFRDDTPKYIIVSELLKTTDKEFFI